jgi:hypothetical protein
MYFIYLLSIQSRRLNSKEVQDDLEQSEGCL